LKRNRPCLLATHQYVPGPLDLQVPPDYRIISVLVVRRTFHEVMGSRFLRSRCRERLAQLIGIYLLLLQNMEEFALRECIFDENMHYVSVLFRYILQSVQKEVYL